MDDNHRFDPRSFLLFFSFYLINTLYTHFQYSFVKRVSKKDRERERERERETRLNQFNDHFKMKECPMGIFICTYIKVLMKDEYTITVQGGYCAILSRFVRASMHRDCIVSARSKKIKNLTFFFLSNHSMHHGHSYLTPPFILQSLY